LVALTTVQQLLNLQSHGIADLAAGICTQEPPYTSLLRKPALAGKGKWQLLMMK
jgi:hypothetical protein